MSRTLPAGQSESFSYDERDRLTGISYPGGRTIGYDDLYRLTSETVSDATLGDRTATWTYDAVGNRLSEVETRTAGTDTTTYSYDANDRLLTETVTGLNPDTLTYSYDNNGNTLTRIDGSGTTSYAYDSRNRLSDLNSGQTTYRYDASGIRMSETSSGLTTNYLVDPNRDYAQVVEESFDLNSFAEVRYTYGDDLLAQHRRVDALTTTSSTYHFDGIGSTRRLTDTNSLVTDSYAYTAFGELVGSTGTTQNDYLYTGEQFDPNLGFYYLRARYYNAGIGRFQTMDTFAGRAFEPITLHKYLYANTSPANYVDPTGNVSIASVVSGLNTAATLATVGLTSYNATGSLLEGDLYGAGREVAIGAISVAVLLKGPQMFKALFGSCTRWCTLFYRFTQAERAVIAEAKSFQAAGALEKARVAVATGSQVEITVGTRVAIVVPEYTGSGMTLFADDAFVIGANAVRTEVEFSKTLLHELYRLSFQRGVNAGAVGASSAPTAAAFNFAEDAVQLFVR